MSGIPGCVDLFFRRVLGMSEGGMVINTERLLEGHEKTWMVLMGSRYSATWSTSVSAVTREVWPGPSVEQLMFSGGAWRPLDV